MPQVIGISLQALSLLATLIWASRALKRSPSKSTFPILPLAIGPFLGTLLGYTMPYFSLSTQTQIRVGALITGGLFLFWGSHIIFSALLQDRGKLPRLLLFEKVGILFLPMSILGALWGLAMGNDLAYIVSDTYKFAFFSIVFLATIMAVKPEKASRATSAILQLVLIGFAFELTSQLISLALEGPSRGLPIGPAFFLLPYLLAVEATGGHDPVFKTNERPSGSSPVCGVR